MTRLIPLLAAIVAMIALAGVVLVERNAEQRAAALSQEVARLRLTIDLQAQRNDSLTAQADTGFADALLALQERLVVLEDKLENQVPAAAVATGSVPAADASASEPIDPNLPTEDCIPRGTRFMAVTGESYVICQSTAVVRVTAITGDNVVVEGAGVITETGFANIAGTSCTLLVFSADVEGFAEMRVNCT